MKTRQLTQMTRLTDNGRVQSVAISPDGRYVVYARREGDEESLWLRQVATRSSVQLLPTGTGFHGLTFSPDGNYIFFVRSDEKDPFFKYLYAMPTLGGPARKLITDVDSPVTFSPDGRRFVYERCIPPRNDIELRIANADGSADNLLAIIHDGSGFSFPARPELVAEWANHRRSSTYYEPASTVGAGDCVRSGREHEGVVFEPTSDWSVRVGAPG
jgi:Tol biopolymer transport system component